MTAATGRSEGGPRRGSLHRPIPVVESGEEPLPRSFVARGFGQREVALPARELRLHRPHHLAIFPALGTAGNRMGPEDMPSPFTKCFTPASMPRVIVQQPSEAHPAARGCW